MTSSSGKAVRQELVPSQIKGGFIDILKDAQSLFPYSDSSLRVKVYFDSDNDSPVEINLTGWKHKTPMLTGLRQWFVANNAKAGDIIEIAKLSSGSFRVSFVRNSKSVKDPQEPLSLISSPLNAGSHSEALPLQPRSGKGYFAIECSEREIRAWSSSRLPFEPQGWLLDFRNKLRVAARSLHSDGPCTLYAYYSSACRDTVDAENVLFYNVGPAYFSHLDCRTLIFERSYSSPSGSKICADAMEGVTFPHFHYYSLLDSTNRNWKTKDVLAEFEYSLTPTKSSYRLEDFWYSLKKGNVKTISSVTPFNGYIGLNLRVSAPTFAPFRLIPMMKPLIDGTISAFHADFDTDDEIVEIIANRLSEEPDQIRRMIRDDSHAELGRRSLVRKWNNSIQWNPADDNLVSVELSLEHSSQQPTTMQGDLFSVVPG